MENMIVPLAAIEKRKTHKVVLKRLYWPRIKEDITHFVNAWVDAEWTEPLTKSKAALCNRCLSHRAMVLYMHEFHHKFAGVTRIWCHLGDGGTVCQVGTYGADCGNCNRVGNRIANSQKLVEAPWVAENDCVGSRSEVYKCILDAFL